MKHIAVHRNSMPASTHGETIWRDRGEIDQHHVQNYTSDKTRLFNLSVGKRGFYGKAEIGVFLLAVSIVITGTINVEISWGQTFKVFRQRRFKPRL